MALMSKLSFPELEPVHLFHTRSSADRGRIEPIQNHFTSCRRLMLPYAYNNTFLVWETLFNIYFSVNMSSTGHIQTGNNTCRPLENIAVTIFFFSFPSNYHAYIIFCTETYRIVVVSNVLFSNVYAMVEKRCVASC